MCPELPSWIGSGGVPGPELTRRFGFFTTVRHRCRRSSSPPSDTTSDQGICDSPRAGPLAKTAGVQPTCNSESTGSAIRRLSPRPQHRQRKGFPESSVKGWSQPVQCFCHLGNHANPFFVEECHEVIEADAAIACTDRSEE